jgi:preprotein translocase subunit YajC
MGARRGIRRIKMHPWFWWILIFILLFVIPAKRALQHRQIMVSKRNRVKRRKGENVMNELVKSYIGKEVIVWAGNSSGVNGTITKIEENWVELEDKYGTQILNTDYISRIQEYPRNKNGKKKAVIV